MPLTAFDHVNIRTTKLDEMITWYGAVLDLHPGKRPPFAFPGAWLYLGGTAVIHLVECAAPCAPGTELSLEHFAFRGRGMADIRARLEANGVTYTIDPVPGFPVVQINLHDPEGNHIHIDFDAAEAEAA